MRAERLVRPLRLPSEQDLAVALLDVEAVEARQNPTDVVADHFVAPDVVPFEPVQHGSQIAAVRSQVSVVVHVPPARSIDRLAERMTAEQVAAAKRAADAFLERYRDS